MSGFALLYFDIKSRFKSESSESRATIELDTTLIERDDVTLPHTIPGQKGAEEL